jgi:hypothetical protein
MVKKKKLTQDYGARNLRSIFKKNLPHYGVKVTAIGAEDWGWMVELDNDEFPLTEPIFKKPNHTAMFSNRFREQLVSQQRRPERIIRSELHTC